MADSLSTWRKKIKKTITNCSMQYLSSEFCFRDPIRPIKNNSEIIYSPADGIILDIVKVDRVSCPIYSKMGSINLSTLSYDMVEEGEYICITIFLTFYDPHIIRMPIDGIISRIDLPPMYVQDMPMLDYESMIMKQRISEIDRSVVASFAFNQRTLFEIVSPINGYKIYLLLTADYDIDTIVSFFTGSNRAMKQGQRIGQIRYGSMATLVVPANCGLEIYAKYLYHVEAGIDPILIKNE